MKTAPKHDFNTKIFKLTSQLSLRVILFKYDLSLCLIFKTILYLHKINLYYINLVKKSIKLIYSLSHVIIRGWQKN